MRRLLVVACLIIFVDVAFYEAITPLLAHYRNELGLGERDAGILVGSYAVASVVFSLPAGFVASRVGPRRVIVVALAIFGVSGAAFGSVNAIEPLVIARFIQGAAGAALWVGALTWLINSTPIDRRGAVIGIALGMAVVGAMLGPVFGALAGEIGTEIVFGAVLVASGALLVASLSIPDVTVREGNSTAEVARVFRSRRVVPAAGMVAVPSTMFGLAAVLVPLQIDDLGGSSLLVAAGFAAGGAIQAVVSPVVGRFSDRHGRMLPFAIGSTVGAIAITLVAVPSIAVVLGALMGAAVGAGMSFAPGFARLSDNALAAGLHQSYATALSNMAWAVGQVLGAVAGGALAEIAGPLAPCLVVSAMLACSALVARSRLRLA